MKSDRAFAAGPFLAAANVTALIICAAGCAAAARGAFAWWPYALILLSASLGAGLAAALAFAHPPDGVPPAEEDEEDGEDG